MLFSFEGLKDPPDLITVTSVKAIGVMMAGIGCWPWGVGWLGAGGVAAAAAYELSVRFTWVRVGLAWFVPSFPLLLLFVTGTQSSFGASCPTIGRACPFVRVLIR